MADREGKPKKKGKDDVSVLGSLPSSRPNRIGRERQSATTDSTAAPIGAPKPKAAALRPKAATSKPRTAKPKPQQPKAKPTAAHPSTPNPAPHAEPRGPRPVRAGAPTLSDAPAPEDRPGEAPPSPSGTELVSTVVQAAGELGKIGLTVGGQVLRRAVSKLPKP